MVTDMYLSPVKGGLKSTKGPLQIHICNALAVNPLDSQRTKNLPESIPFSDKTDHQGLLQVLQASRKDDKGPEWWAEFEQELAESRLVLRRNS